MEEKREKMKKFESPPKVLKNFFNKEEINDFLDLYKKLFILVLH